MFTVAQFVQLYELLNRDMVDEDCGIRCQQYCCRVPGTVKYFLPGEEEAFISQPNNMEIVDYYFYKGYRSRVSGCCSCTRDQRPFCCRIFPFDQK